MVRGPPKVTVPPEILSVVEESTFTAPVPVLSSFPEATLRLELLFRFTELTERVPPKKADVSKVPPLITRLAEPKAPAERIRREPEARVI